MKALFPGRGTPSTGSALRKFLAFRLANFCQGAPIFEGFSKLKTDWELMNDLEKLSIKEARMSSLAEFFV